MGFHDRLNGAANRAEQAKTGAELHVFRDRRFERADEAVEKSHDRMLVPPSRVVSGIRRAR